MMNYRWDVDEKILNYIYIYIYTLNNKIYKPLGWSGSRRMGLDQQNLFLPKMESDNVNHEECGIFYIPEIKFFVITFRSLSSNPYV